MATQEYDGYCCYSGKLIRLLPDGTLDPSFNIVSTPSMVGSFGIQQDGKIVYTENGEEDLGDMTQAIKRLLPDGTPDPTFNIGSGPSNEFGVVALDANDDILVGGYFYQINGIGRNNIARLHGNSNICAQVDFLCRAGGLPIADMKVELFKITGTGIELEGSTAFTDASGHAQYIDIPEGQYICRASPEPTNSAQQNMLSTYTNETYVWQQATVIDISCLIGVNDTIDVIMLPDPGNFPGVAMGTVRYMTDPPGLPTENSMLAVRSYVTGDPIPGVTCVLEKDTTSADIPSGNYFPFQLYVTSTAGEFGFANLPEGHYKIHVDMPGLPMAETHLFQITASESTFENLNFYVDPNDAIYINDVMGVDELPSAMMWTVFPNPFTAQVTLRNGSDWFWAGYQILSSDGRLMMEGSVKSTSELLDLSDLSAGMYFLTLRSETGVATIKLIKQ